MEGGLRAWLVSVSMGGGTIASPLIQDRTVAKEGQFTWTARVEINADDACSGTVVSPTVILTPVTARWGPKRRGPM